MLCLGKWIDKVIISQTCDCYVYILVLLTMDSVKHGGFNYLMCDEVSWHFDTRFSCRCHTVWIKIRNSSESGIQRNLPMPHQEKYVKKGNFFSNFDGQHWSFDVISCHLYVFWSVLLLFMIGNIKKIKLCHIRFYFFYGT